MTTDNPSNSFTKNKNLYIYPRAAITSVALDMPVLSSNASYTLNDCTSSNTSACTTTSDGSTTVINPTMSARLTTRGKGYLLQPRRDQGKAPPRVSPTPMTLSLLTRMGVGTGCGPRYGCSPRTTHTALGPSWARSTYVSHPPFLPLLLLTLYTQLMESRGNLPPLGTSNVRASGAEVQFGPVFDHFGQTGT